jgi:hypothetical protein
MNDRLMIAALMVLMAFPATRTDLQQSAVLKYPFFLMYGAKSTTSQDVLPIVVDASGRLNVSGTVTGLVYVLPVYPSWTITGNVQVPLGVTVSGYAVVQPGVGAVFSVTSSGGPWLVTQGTNPWTVTASGGVWNVVQNTNPWTVTASGGVWNVVQNTSPWLVNSYWPTWTITGNVVLPLGVTVSGYAIVQAGVGANFPVTPVWPTLTITGVVAADMYGNAGYAQVLISSTIWNSALIPGWQSNGIVAVVTNTLYAQAVAYATPSAGEPPTAVTNMTGYQWLSGGQGRSWTALDVTGPWTLKAGTLASNTEYFALGGGIARNTNYTQHFLMQPPTTPYPGTSAYLLTTSAITANGGWNMVAITTSPTGDQTASGVYFPLHVANLSSLKANIINATMASGTIMRDSNVEVSASKFTGSNGSPSGNALYTAPVAWAGYASVPLTATGAGTNLDNAQIVAPARYIYTTGALSTTVSCYGKGPYALNGRPFTVSVVTAGAYGTSIYVDASNANAAPAETDATGWRCISSPRWVLAQPLGGLDGQVDANTMYFSGVKWVRFRLEVAAQSNTTCNVLGQE